MGKARRTVASVRLMVRGGSLENSGAVIGDVVTGCHSAGLMAGVSETGARRAKTASCAGWGAAPAPQMKPQHL